MKLTTVTLSFLAAIFSLLVSMVIAAPFSTITTCTTTTITPSPSETVTTTTLTPTSTSLTLTTTTITMPSSTFTSYTTITAPVPTGTTVPEYGQCGGLGYNGPTTCEDPFVCTCSSAWWCQCQAATAEEFELERNIPGTAPADETPPAFRPDFVTSARYWAADTPVTLSLAPEAPQTS